MNLLELLDEIQSACLPGIWSQGMALARTGSVLKDSSGEDEVLFRVRTPDRPVSRKVSLWPEDEDWYCDCGSPQRVCSHVAAAVITLKNPKLGVKNEETTRPHSSTLSYRFTRKSGRLFFDRWISTVEGQEEILSVSLVSLMGGISSGRIQFRSITATKEDYTVDGLISEVKNQEWDSIRFNRLLKSLADCTNVLLDGQPVRTSSQTLKIGARLTDEGTGFRLKLVEVPGVTESFSNGVALCGNTLKSFEIPNLTPAEKTLLAGQGTYFTKTEVRTLLVEILPNLEKKISIENEAKNLPKLLRVAPKIVLELKKELGSETLSVLPVLKYGDEKDIIYIPDPIAEKTLIRKLQSELQLLPGQVVKFDGEIAVDFVQRIQAWETQGDGKAAFHLEGSLSPTLQFHEKSFDFAFGTGDSSKKADPNRVFQAWRENQNYVPLLSGGWAPLPKDWLNRYGEQIQALINARNSKNEIPLFMIPELTQFCEEINHTYPDDYRKFKTLLSQVEKIDNFPLPDDLSATLRPYQRVGVNWLSFLRDSKMGALLADDMGLGKTLQALCSIRGKTLIVSPRSVLHGWAKQIEQFRPSLKYSVYHGANRSLKERTDITLTSYAMLRIDREILAQEEWETIILDEAQTIKNPDSQVTKAAHSLRATFRIALSGTPIENRLTDLWSQFQFLNPGLLGTLDDFRDQFSTPVSQGDQNQIKRLQNKIKPFILRRLKKDVATELPPRTETVLYCELSEDERNLYEAILATARKEVLQKLEAGDGVFAALEVLLRLRQACCHMALIPGQTSISSSKIDLLLQTLESSIALGHRALIFSQWTSYLDLIEPHLAKAGITYSRLDGSTSNRAQVVDEFQSDKGPHVMLISLKAGGVGLTLTAADQIFLMDPWWNPAVEDQAADRAHRIGQNNPVLIHRLVAENTIEDRVLNLQKAKYEMAQAVLQGTPGAGSLSKDDILALLR